MSEVNQTSAAAHVDALLEQVAELEGRHALEADAADAELEDVLRFLRREETGHLQCDRPHHAHYVQELIDRFEQWEHRR